MTPIDLVPFAEHSQKLPSQLLSPKQIKDNRHTMKLLFAHWLDFVVVMGIIGMMSALFSHGVQFFMVTKGLRLALPANSASTFMSSLVPFTIFNYFFFSYFMNQGQSWGMLMMKKRIEIQNKNFMSAFKWAAWSTMLCLSCGIVYAFTKTKWTGVKEHDHLYSDLVAFRNDDSINLLNTVEKWSAEVPPELEEWQKAA